MPCEHLEVASLDEVAAVEVVLTCMSEPGDPVRVAACMALFTLGCRNGVAAYAREDIICEVVECFIHALEPLAPLLSGGGASAAIGGALGTAAAAGACATLIDEVLGKSAPAVREPLEKVWTSQGAGVKAVRQRGVGALRRAWDVGLTIFCWRPPARPPTDRCSPRPRS
jgi:hypothetical protein